MTVGTVWLQLKAAELVQSLAGTPEEQTDRVGNVDGPVWLCERVQKERGETEPTLVSSFISSALNPVGNGTEDNLIMYHADNVMHCKLSKHFVVSNLYDTIVQNSP